MMVRAKLLSGAVLAVLGAGVVCPACCGDSGGGGATPRTAVADGGARATSPAAAFEIATFRVDGMTCGGCALATEIAVRRLEGVASVRASYDANSGAGRASVQYDPIKSERLCNLPSAG